MTGLLRQRVGTGPLALLRHEPAERPEVDVEALLGRHLDREVDREAVGVVQLERVLAGDPRPTAGADLRGGRIEQRDPGLERAAEGVLLAVDDRGDPVEVPLELGVGLLHRVLGDRQQLTQRRPGHAEQTQRADGAAQQTTQHVAAALVAGAHPVADEHERAADVVRDDAHPHVVLLGAGLARPVGLAGQLDHALDDGIDLVDLVHVVLALEQERDALEAGAGVDRLGVELP